MAKKVAGFNETVYDILNYVEVTDGGTTTNITVNVAVSALPTSPSMGNPAFQANDTNGVTDGCCVIPSTATAKFHYIRPDTTTFVVDAVDFISGGTHPPTRPN